MRDGKPLVTLKLAGSLDMRIATKTGESKWITGEAARARAHLIRAQHDAIMVGSGTVLADDPSLDVRLPGFDNARKVRVVVDGRLRTPLTAKLVRTAKSQPSWIVHRPDAEKIAPQLLSAASKCCRSHRGRMATPHPTRSSKRLPPRALRD